MSPPRTFQLDVVSLAGPIWSGPVRQVGLPGSAGRFGVLAGHLPLLATLREGMLHIDPEQGERVEVYLSGGYVEVQPDAVTVVADLAVREADWDRAQAEAAQQRARSLMAQAFTEDAYLALHLELMHRYAHELRQAKR